MARAGSWMLQAASKQLQHLQLQRAAACIGTLQVVRLCHDDHFQKSLYFFQARKKAEQDKKVKTDPVAQLEQDLGKIVSQNEVSGSSMGPRSPLRQRIDLLLSLGCTGEQILDRVHILNIPEAKILKRATLLKSLGCTQLDVELLAFCSYKARNSLKKYLDKRESRNRAFCTVLQCSPAELSKLKLRFPTLEHCHGLSGEDVLEKAKLFQRYGITTEEIRLCPAVLNTKMENLEERLELLDKLRRQGDIQFERYPLKTITERKRLFDNIVRRAVSGKAELDGTPISSVKIAVRLGVTPQDIERVIINIPKLNRSTILKKIDFLLAEGVPKADLVSHIYIFKQPMQLLKAAVKESLKLGLGRPNILTIISFLRLGRLPDKQVTRGRQRTFVASLFQINSKDLPLAEFLKPLWSADRLTITRNFEFLQSVGFSEEDIFSCMILLSHDEDSLHDYYHSLWQRADLAGYADLEVWKDRRKQLWLLQYIIERDMNFLSPVFHADVEFDQGLPFGADYGMSASSPEFPDTAKSTWEPPALVDHDDDEFSQTAQE